MYPKSKSPLELKYERYRGMCGEAWQNVRYIPIDNGIQQHGGDGGIWLLLCVYQYTGSMTTGQRGILVYNIRTQYTTAITRASQRPGACITCVRACILLYYYNIIILLYLYIYITILSLYCSIWLYGYIAI